MTHLSTIFALVGSLTFVQFASAASLAIESVNVECKVVNGQTHTVRVAMVYNPATLGFPVGVNHRYSFQNTGTGQISTFYYGSLHSPALTTFPLPQGSYNLTVAFSNESVMNAPALPGSVVYWNNIKVPATVSTHGRGTGCEFASIANRANQIAPAVKPKTN